MRVRVKKMNWERGERGPGDGVMGERGGVDE